MRPGIGTAACALAVVAIVVGFACEPIVGTPGPAAPINACPLHPCDAYKPSGAPVCTDGICTVPSTTSNLLLVIGLATDSYLAPGRTYITTLNGGPSASAALGECALPNCPSAAEDGGPPVCALPRWIQDLSGYVVEPNAAVEANWSLGNMGNTSLPVQATFRRLFGASPQGPQDALDLGLPVEPIEADIITTLGGTFGPNGSPQIQFKTYMQNGCYERTLQPLAPLSTAFPPEIKAWPPDQSEPLLDFDTTREETLPTGGSRVRPSFDIGRAAGLAGWVAYLRNTQTKRIFSNVVPLQGSLAPGVTLLTNHDPVEALTGLELVLEPPPGQPLPTEVFAPTAKEIVSSVVYPPLPTPVTVTGRIETPAGAPVPAAVYFTATDITDRNGQRFPPNFEFVTSVSTTTDARTGASTYSALLPQGHFRIAVRPTDGMSAVTVVSRAVGGEGNEMTGVDVDVAPLVTVSGTAKVADGRPLAEAVVEVLPTACAPITGSTSMTDVFVDCLPRTAYAGTADDGTFNLAVDPGQYLLRVRPREGSRLPWKIQPIVVGPTALPVGEVVIPAPISVGMTLTDTAKPNPVVNAVVRVFTDPTQTGSAVELGEAITDVKGRYEMYIAPPPTPVASPGF
jgi:hypothetical protein